MPPLRFPTALAFTVLGAAAGATATSCGDTTPTVDARCTYCIYAGSDNGNCPPPTCATGPRQDVCPAGCIPEPIT